MDKLISEQAIVDVLRKGYWDKNLQSAKDDPCVIDAMIDWAIRQIKAMPPAEPTDEQVKEYCKKRDLKLVEYDFMVHIIKETLSAEPSRDMKEIEEVINCDADAETKCKMISNILTAKPHYFEKQEPCEEDVIALMKNFLIK